MLSSHWCQSWEGFQSILEKCGTITPMNRIGPRNAVIEAESREEAMMIKILRRERFTPILWA